MHFWTDGNRLELGPFYADQNHGIWVIGKRGFAEERTESTVAANSVREKILHLTNGVQDGESSVMVWLLKLMGVYREAGTIKLSPEAACVLWCYHDEFREALRKANQAGNGSIFLKHLHKLIGMEAPALNLHIETGVNTPMGVMFCIP